MLKLNGKEMNRRLQEILARTENNGENEKEKTKSQ